MLIIYRKRSIEKIITRGREIDSFPLSVDIIIPQLRRNEEVYCVVYSSEKSTWRYIDDIVALNSILSYVNGSKDRSIKFILINRCTHRSIIRKEVSVFYVSKRLA